jgi:hypothetical protein
MLGDSFGSWRPDVEKMRRRRMWDKCAEVYLYRNRGIARDGKVSRAEVKQVRWDAVGTGVMQTRPRHVAQL